MRRNVTAFFYFYALIFVAMWAGHIYSKLGN